MFYVYRCDMHENCTVVESKNNGRMKTHYDVLPEDHHPVPQQEDNN